MKAYLITWDWKDIPHIDEIAKRVLELSGGEIHIQEVDTDGDQFAWVVSDVKWTDEQLKQMYDERE